MRRALFVSLILSGVWPGSDRARLGAQAPVESGVDTVVINLAEVERRALQYSPLLGKAAVDVELAETQKERASHARYLPEFSLRNIWGPIPRQRGAHNEFGVLVSPDTLLGVSDLSWFTQVNLELLQPIYGFGKIGSRIDAAGHGVDVSRAGFQATQADALLLVRQLYWGVLLGNELQGVLDGVLESAAEAETRLLEQYDEGTATQNDVFKFRLFEYELNRRYREVTSGAELAREGLKAAIGLEPQSPIRMDAADLESLDVELDSLPTYLASARANRPELRQLESGIAATNALRRAEERDAWPTLFVGGGLSINQAPARHDPRNPFWQNDTNYFRGAILLGFDWNLNLVTHRDEARIQQHQTRQLEAQVDPLIKNIEHEVREAYSKARRAQLDIEEGRTALQATENWLRAELQTYDIGIGEIKDVIDAFQANVAMQTQQLRNIADFNTAIAEISRRVGSDIRPG